MIYKIYITFIVISNKHQTSPRTAHLDFKSIFPGQIF